MDRIVTLAILVTLFLPAAPLTARQWTDSSGVFTVEAELVEVTGRNKSAQFRRESAFAATIPQHVPRQLGISSSRFPVFLSPHLSVSSSDLSVASAER